jgi:hypothetical protein
MPIKIFNGKVMPKLNPKYREGFASGSANLKTAGTAI